MATGTISELWRYPVKSMRGERVDRSGVTESGLLGDRAYAVVDVESGRVCSAKHPRLWGPLLHCEARYRVEPAPPDAAEPAPVAIALPDGTETGSDDPDVEARLSRLLGRRVSLASVAPEGNSYLAVWPDGVAPADFVAGTAVGDAAAEGEGTLTELTNAAAAPPGTFFDVAAVHLLTRSTLARLGELAPGVGADSAARFRPNVVLDGDGDPFAENGWTGVTVHLGDPVAASVLIPTMRCIMTTLPQGDLPRAREVLQAVGRHNRIEIPGLGTWSCVGAYASVVTGGSVSTGDPWSAGWTGDQAVRPAGA